EPTETTEPEESAEPAETTEPEEEDLVFAPEKTAEPAQSAEPEENEETEEEDLIFIPIKGIETPQPEATMTPEATATPEATMTPAPERSVHIQVNSDTQTLQIGSHITLSAELAGYEGVGYAFNWQYAEADRDGNIIGEWQTAQTDTLSFTYELTEDNLLTAWRMSVTACE
ncbi:MAG: hypothetical protein Q4G52_11450, partial [Clostridia bacterium]|nr:hypothetical protein [Clostridia bacterium]